MRLAFLIYSNCSKNGPYIVLNVHSMACQLFNCSKNHSVPYPTFFHIEWAWQRELSIQFHIESILNEWHVGPTLFCIEWGAGKPLMSIVFSYIDKSRPPILVFSPITHLIFKSAPLQLHCRWSLLKIK